MNPSVISAVLLPNAADTQQLIDCSASINRQTTSLIQLGANCLPHITVAQFIAPIKEASALWEQVRHLKNTVSELSSAGMNFHLDSHDDMLWLDVHYVKSHAIARMQGEISKTDFASTFKICNLTGDSFRPHCTLALFPGQTIPTLNVGSLLFLVGIFKI